MQNLNEVVPIQFGEWQAVPDSSPVVVNPQMRESIDRTYDQTLSRVYTQRGSGRFVMLSIAYGSDQSQDKQVHKPEACYPSQGFQISRSNATEFKIDGRTIPVTTLHATKESRSEYVAYWIIEGDTIVRGALQQNGKRALLALRGVREDGLLFRVSEISTDESKSGELLRSFSDSLIHSIDPAFRSKFVGSKLFTLTDVAP